MSFYVNVFIKMIIEPLKNKLNAMIEVAEVTVK